MNGNGTGKSTSQPGAKLIDDFLRRELRVGDPRNPVEVVTALRRRYTTDAARIDQEAKGLPIRYEASPLVVEVTPTGADTPGSKEERRVRANLESDLAALIDSRDNREWAPEIRGWRDTLLREYADGAAAARFAHDPAMRDRGFLAVRKLGEFARVARLVGVMNLPLNCDYRRLASTLEDAANVIRILMGEALYAAGLADGGFIIQVPVVELRERREALVLAVRRLSGTEVDTDDEGWGDSLAAYRALLDELAARSAPELRVYLREESLTAVLDGLISEVARHDPQALRQIAATVPVEIARLRRLWEIAVSLLAATPAGPVTAALTLFVRALQLFLDAFAESRAGARLIDLAVPLPLAAQQTDEPDREGRRILRDLVSWRGEYSREVECFLSCCGCGTDELRCQVQLDKVLHDLDRAVDLYAQGTGAAPRWGPEERRAAVYGLVARNLADQRGCITPGTAFELLAEASRSALDLLDAIAQLASAAGAPDQRAADSVAFLRHAIAAAEAAAASRAVAEGIRRELFNVPGSIAADIANANHRLGAIVTTARRLPAGVEPALQVLIDILEFVLGVTTNNPADNPATNLGVAINVNVAGVARSAGAAGFDFAATVLQGLALQPALPGLANARATLLQARNALRAAMLRIGDTPARAVPNRVAAQNWAGAVDGAIQQARQALNPPAPPPGVPPVIVTAPERIALTGAIDAGTVAHDLITLRVAVLPDTGQIEPIALWAALHQLANLLARAEPQDPGQRQAVIDSVFDEQLRTEQDWEHLVQSLAPRCLGPGRADLVLAGLDLLRASPRHRSRVDPDVPFLAPTRVSLVHLRESFPAVINTIATHAAAAGHHAGIAQQQAGLADDARREADALQRQAEEAAQQAGRAGQEVMATAERLQLFAERIEAELTEEDLKLIFDLLCFAWEVLADANRAHWRHPGEWNNARRFLHNGWQGQSVRGRALDQHHYELTQITGWEQERQRRPRLSELVQRAAGGYELAQFRGLLEEIDPAGNVHEQFNQKRRLLETCFDIVQHYRSTTRSAT